MRNLLRKGVVMMLLSSLFFCLMSAMVRGLAELDAYTMVMVRFVVGAGAVGALFIAGLQEFRWTNWPWIIVRGVSGGLAVVLSFWAIQNLGLAKGVLFNYTYVIFAAVFAVPVLGERIRPGHWGAIAVAAAGICLLSGVKDPSLRLGDAVALASGVLAGIAVISITRCRETDTPSNIFWSQCVFGIAIAAWPAAGHWTPPAPSQWGLLLVMGLVATAGQLAMTYAYKFTGAAYGSLLSLLTPVGSTAIGVLYFREAQGAGFYAGAALILLACAYLSLRPIKRAASPTP